MKPIDSISKLIEVIVKSFGIKEVSTYLVVDEWNGQSQKSLR